MKLLSYLSFSASIKSLDCGQIQVTGDFFPVCVMWTAPENSGTIIIFVVYFHIMDVFVLH